MVSSLGGVPLHLRPRPHLHSAALVVAMRGGPRVEGPREEGLTHFLEHMLFRGAGRWSDLRALLSACEELGETPDAYTCDDTLVVAWRVDPERAGPALELLAELLVAPRWADLEQERAVILEERLEHVDDRGRAIDLDDLTRATAFGGHPLGRSIVGSAAAIQGVRRSDLSRWRGRLVRRGNLVLAAAGPLDARALRRAARAWERIPAGPALTYPALPLPRARSAWCDLSGSEQVELRFSLPAPGQSHPRYPALVALVDLLDGGSTARVPTALVDAGLCYHAHAELVAFPDLSLLELELSVARDKLEEAVVTALGLLGGAARGIDRGELERARRRRSMHDLSLQDDPLGLAEWVARRELLGLSSDEVRERERVDAVGAAEVAALARAVCRPERLVAVMVGAPSRRQRSAARRALRAWKGAA